MVSHMVEMCTSESYKGSVDFGSVAMETGTGEHASAVDSVQDDHSNLDDGGEGPWSADSGATCHMTPSKHNMCDYEPCTDVSVTVASRHKVPIAGFGKLLMSLGGDDQHTFSANRVAHVTESRVNLFPLQSAVVEHDLQIGVTKSGNVICFT